MIVLLFAAALILFVLDATGVVAVSGWIIGVLAFFPALAIVLAIVATIIVILVIIGMIITGRF